MTDSMEQGELFAGFMPESTQKPRYKSCPKVVENPRRTTILRDSASTSSDTNSYKADNQHPKTKQHYTYDEYLKIFCGNSAAAEYWWKKDMQRLEEEQKCGHTA